MRQQAQWNGRVGHHEQDPGDPNKGLVEAPDDQVRDTHKDDEQGQCEGRSRKDQPASMAPMPRRGR